MTRISNLSSAIWPVSATVETRGNDNSSAEDSERKRPQHEALAGEFSRKMAQQQGTEVTIPVSTLVTFSEEGRERLRSEQQGGDLSSKLPLPDHPDFRVQTYLDIQRTFEKK